MMDVTRSDLGGPTTVKEDSGGSGSRRIHASQALRLLMRSRETALDIWAFALPAVSFLEVTIIGRLMVTEIVLLVMLPWLWSLPDRPALPRWFLVLWAGWLVSQVVTDLVVGSAFTDYARGWAAIAFTLTNFAAIFFLVTTPKRARLFAIGLAVGGLLGLVFVPHPYVALDPWKWGLAGPIALLTAASLSGRFGERWPWVTVAVFVALGGLNVALGYRSLGGVCLVAAGYLTLSALAGRPPSAARQSTLRAALGLVFLGTAGLGVLGGYSAAAAGGFLGPEAQAKYETQSGPLGPLLGGRAEALVSSQAILDSPILGHGSWARDPRYAELLIERQEALGYDVTEEYVGTELIPAHSYLMGAWVRAGALGGLFWLAVGAVAVWLLANLYSVRTQLAPLLVLAAVLLLWDIAFSPYGFGARITAAYGLTLCLLGLRLLPGQRPDPLSSIRATRVQPA